MRAISGGQAAAAADGAAEALASATEGTGAADAELPGARELGAGSGLPLELGGAGRDRDELAGRGAGSLGRHPWTRPKTTSPSVADRNGAEVV